MRLVELQSHEVDLVVLRHLQSVHNAAAQLVTGSRLSDHITPV